MQRGGHKLTMQQRAFQQRNACSLQDERETIRFLRGPSETRHEKARLRNDEKTLSKVAESNMCHGMKS